MSGLIQALPILAFCILIGFYLLGDIVSFKTKSFVPALLIFTILLVIGAWTHVLPENIIDVPGFTSQYATYVILMFMVDMGSSITFKQFASQWKTVIISVSSILGIALLFFTVGFALLGREFSIVSAPPMSGGFVAAMEMSNAAKGLGNSTLSQIPILVFVLHCFPAYISFPASIKKYASKLQKDYVDRNISADKGTNSGTKASKALTDRVPSSCKTSAFYLFSLAVLGVLSTFTALLFNNVISPTVFALIYGMVAHRLGILESNSMKKSGSSGFLMFSSLISIFSTLLTSNPNDILQVLLSILVALVLGVIGVFAGSAISGKLLKQPMSLSFSIGLNCMLGFPINFVMTNEAINSLTEDENEAAYLSSQIMPAMLIAGFVSVTLGSTVFASIMKNFL